MTIRSCFNFPQNHMPWAVHHYVAQLGATALLRALAGSCAQEPAVDEAKTPEAADLVAAGRGGMLHAAAAPAGGGGDGGSGTHHLLPEPLHSATELDQFPVCLKPKAHFSARRPPTAASQQPIVLRGDWRLYEDRKGKPGGG